MYLSVTTLMILLELGKSNPLTLLKETPRLIAWPQSGICTCTCTYICFHFLTMISCLN